MAETESLFSLELLVDWVQLEPPPGEPPQPALAFRLLDFPTLLVYCPRGDGPHLRGESPPPGEEGPPPPHLLFPFGRGKSCLFRLGTEELLAQLSRCPLYVLLLDMCSAPALPRLLGSCALSLATTARGLQEPQGGGTHRGLHPLHDLMGHQVGQLSLVFRLLSLGSGLLRHLPPAAPEPPPQAGTAEPSALPDTVWQQRVQLAGQVLPQVEAPCAAVTQTSPRAEASKGVAVDQQELEAESNVFCPPPMYYSQAPAELPATACSRQVVLERRVVEDQGPRQAKSNPGTAAPSPHWRSSTLEQLPVLSALLQELSLLNPGPRPPVHPQSPMHPQLAWLHCPPEQGPLAAPQDKDGRRSPSPRLPKRNKPGLTTAQGTTPSPTRARKPAPKAPVPADEGSTGPRQPRRRLLYGLTHTLRLRLQHSNPSLLPLHERREQLRQQLVAKESSRCRGILAAAPRSPQLRRRPCRSSHSTPFDENIETLIQNSRAEEQDGGAAGRQQPSGWVLRGCKEDLARSGLLEDMDCTCRSVGGDGKPIPPPLPGALPQETCREGSGIEERGMVQGASVQSSSECRPAEQVLGSLEYSGYSDDFSSLDYTARYSEAPDSSPERALFTPQPLYLDSDCETYSSVKSGPSLKTASIAAPVPLTSSVSPVQSYKRTLNLEKPHGVVTAVTLSDSSPETSSDGQHTSQLDTWTHANITVDNINKSDMNTTIVKANALKNHDMENIQKSFETSQSVRTSQVSSYVPSTISDLEPNALESAVLDPLWKEETRSTHATSDISQPYKLITELVVNQLPGYTL